MNALVHLRVAAFLEGVSLLVLVLVAMPLKHFFAMPMAVRVVGSVHGLLFLVFLSLLFRVVLERRWPLRRALGAVVASLLPGGTFVLDRALVRELAAAKNTEAAAP